MKNQPEISIIVPTLNNAELIPAFLQSIHNQDFSKDEIEILFVDGGSTDKTLEIAKKNNIKVIPNPHVLAEPAINLGMKNARGKLFMVLATDNHFYNPKAFSTITNVFKNKDIYAAFPIHSSSKKDSIFTKYHNTFTDPFNHFVYGDAANARTFYREYKTLTHNKLYDIYDYDSSNTRPLIALAQGFTIRSSYRREEKDIFDDCKPVLKLIQENKQIAYIHSVSLYHHTIHGLDHFLRKQRWATQNALANKNYGISYRYHQLSASQRLRMILWPAYALTFVFPLIYAIYGFLRDREPLWLLHPFFCFLSAYASCMQVVMYNMDKLKEVSRQ